MRRSSPANWTGISWQTNDLDAQTKFETARPADGSAVVSVRGLVLLMWFLGSIPVCFFRPFYGIVLWTIVAFTSPQWYTWGAAQMVPWAVIIAVPTIAGYLKSGPNFSRFFARESILVGLLWLWFCVTTLISINSPLFSEHAVPTLERFNIVCKIFVMVFITIGIVDSFARLRLLVIVMASCFGFFVAKSLPFLIATGGSARVYGPERSMIADNNDFGLALNMTLPMFFFLAKTETNFWMKRIWGALFVMTIPTIFFTYSRGALFSLLVVLGVMILRLRQRFILIPVVGAGMALAVLYAPESWKERMNPSTDNMLDKSARGRINAWKFAVHLTADYPVTGGGFETFTPALFQLYASDPLEVHGPHSIYFGILGEHGIPGLMLFLALVGTAFYSLYEIAKWGRVYGDATAVAYANMFRFSLVGFLTAGLFLGRAYFDYAYTIFACIVVLRRACFEHWNSQEIEEGYEPEEQMAQAG
jgi:probable O-glycosylation ligase (exosortase A-associated)